MNFIRYSTGGSGMILDHFDEGHVSTFYFVIMQYHIDDPFY